MPHPHPSTARIGRRFVVAALAAALVVALTLAPRTIVGPARGAFMDAAYAVAEPLVGGMTYNEVEVVLNVLLFVPLGVALAVLLPGRWWLLAPVGGLLASLTVEYLQSAIPGRVPDLGDVLCNSAGALTGAAVVGMVRLLSRPVLTRRGERGSMRAP